MSRVAVVRTRPESVIEDIGRLMDFAGGAEILPAGTQAVLKPAFVSGNRMIPGHGTTPWQLDGVIQKLGNLGYKSLSVVISGPISGSAYMGERIYRLSGLCHNQRVPVLYSFLSSDMNRVRYIPRVPLRCIGRKYPEGIEIPEYFIGRSMVHLPSCEGDYASLISGAMGNAVSGLAGRDRNYSMYTEINEALVDLLAIQKEIHPGLFAVCDLTAAGATSFRADKVRQDDKVLLASCDMVAVDAVKACLAGFKPMNIPYIRMAHEDGLGIGDNRCIDLVGDDISDLKYTLRKGKREKKAARIWAGFTKYSKPLDYDARIIYAGMRFCSLCHDHMWYPLAMKKRVRRWLRCSWGRLFQTY